LIHALARLCACHAGNVGMFFAIAAIPLMLAVGAGLDYSRGSTIRQQLSNAADAAALGAAKTAASEFSAGAGNWHARGVAAGQALFAADTKSITARNISVGTPTISITRSGTTFAAQVSSTVSVPTVLMRIVQVNSLNVSVMNAASVGTTGYVDIHIVIDVSASMGIGAAASDQQTLETTNGCTLACHYADVYSDPDNLAQARASGASLRIDVVKQAVVSALGQLNGGQIRIAVYTLSNTLTNVFPLSSNITAAITAVNGVDLASQNGEGGKNATYGLQQLNALLPTAGSGASASSPLGVVILATDAVQDSNQFVYSSGPGSLMQAVPDPNFVSYSPSQSFPGYAGNPIIETIDPGSCSPIKSKGYTFMTIYMQYLVPTLQPDASDPRYSYIAQTLDPLLTSRMSACATSASYAAFASSPSSIQTAIGSLFSAASGMALRLTQ
jgi:Flp pilus assembly protein TadG